MKTIRDLLVAQDRAAASAPPASEVGQVVSAPVDGRVDVNCTGVAESMLVTTATASVTAGQSVLVLRTRQGAVVTDILPVSVNDPGPVQDITFAALTGTALIPATFSYSWRDGTAFDYIDDVRAGALGSDGSWTGGWFYQGGPAAELYGATITACSVMVQRASGGTPGAQAVQIFQSNVGDWPTTDLQPPTAVGSATSVTLDVGKRAWVDLPASVGQSMVDTSAGLMIARSGVPMVRLEGVSSNPESGLVRLAWSL